MRHPFEAKKVDTWDARFMALASHCAEWSKDPSTKVGAVIVDDLRIPQALGYNGFPRGVDDSPEKYADREVKLPRVVHAELNAILNANGSVRGSSLYVTLPPCSSCACAIIQAGIRRVVLSRPGAEVAPHWREQWRISEEMFNEAGVEVKYV